MSRFHVRAAILILLLAVFRVSAQKVRNFKDLKPGEFSWLLELAGKPAAAGTGDSRFQDVEKHALSILKAKFDLGDPPEGNTLVRDEILSALNGVPDPIETRLGRYVILSGCRTAQCSDRVFVWIDTERGLALAVLLIPSSSDLPGTTPQMLIASRQLDAKRIDPGELPELFWTHWQEWAYERHLPEVMTERIVNMYGGVSVMFHDDETLCKDSVATYSAVQCGQKALHSATVDLDALFSQLQSRLNPGSQGRIELDKGQALWTAYKDSTCKAAAQLFEGGTGAPVTSLECERSLTHDRVRTLNDIYFMPLYN